jgi:hypothetical protein
MSAKATVVSEFLLSMRTRGWNSTAFFASAHTNWKTELSISTVVPKTRLANQGAEGVLWWVEAGVLPGCGGNGLLREAPF